MIYVLIGIVALPWVLSLVHAMFILHPRVGGDGEPSVDVYLAVRNEAATIIACLEAIRMQTNVARIIVIDDGSIDATQQRLADIGAQEPRLHCLQVRPGDREGKSGALASAIAQCPPTSAWLLFTDADVAFDPGGIVALQRVAEKCDVGFVTAWMRCREMTFWSLLFAPQVTLFLLRFLPVFALDAADPRIAAANGQCLLVRAELYRRSGGHEAITGLVEDVALARSVKRVGGHIRLLSGRHIGSYRAYGSFAANVRGYGRSLAFGLGPIGALGFAVWQLCSAALTVLTLMCTRANPLLVILVVFLSRGGNIIAFSENVVSLVLAPIADVCFAVAAILGAYERLTGRSTWRGRMISDAKPPTS